MFDLFEHYLDHSHRTATAFADAVIDVVRRLEDHPRSGSPRPELGEGIRAAHANAYRTTLYYLVTEGPDPVVTVLRVLRQERNVTGDDLGGDDLS